MKPGNTFWAYCLLIGLISCNKKEAKNPEANAVPKISIAVSDTLENECNQYLAPHIEIWNRTGKENLIDSYDEEIEDKYVMSDGWDSDNKPYPKKFDLKCIVVNQALFYEYEDVSEIGVWNLVIKMRFETGQNADYLFPLNSKLTEPVKLLKKEISDQDFKDDSSTEFWIKGIPFEDAYKKVRDEGRFINKIIFEILFSKGKNVCNYKHEFFMRERAEP